MKRKRLGYTRVCIRADLNQPLVPEVQVGSPARTFWQRFAYENLGGLYSDCGCLLHLDGRCRKGVDQNSAAEDEVEFELAGQRETKVAVPRGLFAGGGRRWRRLSEWVFRRPRAGREFKGLTVGGGSHLGLLDARLVKLIPSDDHRSNDGRHHRDDEPEVGSLC